MTDRQLIGQPEGASWPADWNKGDRCECGHTAWEHNAWLGENPRGFCEGGDPLCDCTKMPHEVPGGDEDD